MSSATTPTPPLSENLGHSLSTDYFFLREQLTENELAVLRRVRQFVDDEVLPVIGGYWERAGSRGHSSTGSVSWASSARRSAATGAPASTRSRVG